MPRRFALPVLFIAIGWSGRASAHAASAISPNAFWQSWTFDPLVLAPMLLVHWLYGRGWLRLREGRRSRAAASCFVAGEIALFVALVSPIDALGETLLSAHMVQHMLLVAVAAPLLLLGRPGIVLGAALPKSSMRRLAVTAGVRPLALGMARLTGLLPATLLHGLALWLWHAPPAFEAALERDVIHTFEHLSFFGTGILFWFALLRAGRTARGAPAGALASFATFLHGGLLGGLLSLAPAPLYPAYGDRPLLWGLDPLTDQQLAGLIMWVPIGPVYLAATLWMVMKLLTPGRAVV